jgi:PKD repeat protein
MFTIMTIGIGSADSLDVELINQIDGNFKDVVISGNYAYVGENQDLVIFDISDAANPLEVGRIGTSYDVDEVATSGDLVYVIARNKLVIVDVTDPSEPIIEGNYNPIAFPYVCDIEVSGNYAYVVCTSGDFFIEDISNPSSPILKGSIDDLGQLNNVVISGNYAYISTYSGVDGVDISVPSSPSEIGYYGVPEYTQDVYISEKYMYVIFDADSAWDLEIVDVSNPFSPIFRGSYGYNESSELYADNDIAFSGNYAYLAVSTGLEIVDVSSHSSPKLAGIYNVVGGKKEVAVVGNYVYLATGDGLSILRVDKAPAIDQSTATTTSYPATYDNRLRESSPSSVLSTTAYVDLGKSTSISRDVMMFDLSDYETTDTIDKAILSLYWYYPADKTRTSDTVVEIYRPVEWDPKYVSWKNGVSGKAWANAGGSWYDKNCIAQGTTPYASINFPAGKVPDNKYYEFDVTDLVKEYVSGEYDNTGFFLKAKDESGNYMAFYSSDWSNSEQRPKLTITSISGSVDDTPADEPVDEPVDELPVAHAGDDIAATTGSAVNFDAGASTDDNGIDSYSWDFDVSDGITSEATGVMAENTYASPGTYTVTLTVTDTAGQKSTDTLKVIVKSSSVIYTPVYDNRLRESSPSTVLSTTGYIDVGRSISISRDVMMFDLSDYQTTGKISKATLSLYWYYPVDKTRTSDTVVEIYRPVEWDPKYVSWKSSGSGKSWSNAGGSWYDRNGVAQGTAPYASVTFSASKVPDNKYYEFDVTDLVQEYISGESKNTGFLLKAKAENGNYIAFYSSDWTNPEQRPKLTITS